MERVNVERSGHHCVRNVKVKWTKVAFYLSFFLHFACSVVFRPECLIFSATCLPLSRKVSVSEIIILIIIMKEKTNECNYEHISCAKLAIPAKKKRVGGQQCWRIQN